MVLLRLAWELFRISLFVLGGGYSILIVADRVFSEKKAIEEGELLDQLSIFQMLPGLIAMHTAVYLGRKRAGVLGAVVAVMAVILPSVLIFSFVSAYYKSIPTDNPYLASAFVGLTASIAGIIIATIIKSWRKFINTAFAWSLLAAGIAAIGGLNLPVAAVIVTAALAGMLAEIGESEFRKRQSRSRRFPSHALAFFVFLKYGLLSFGGGFVLVPIYIQDFVGATAPFLQLSPIEFSDIMALTQMTPGPVGINCATFFGYRLAGVGGALLASIFLVLPGSILSYIALSSIERFKSSVIVRGILRGIRPVTVALMIVALRPFLDRSIFDGSGFFNTIGLILVIISIAMSMYRKINVTFVIFGCALVSSALKADDITITQYPDADAVIVDSDEFTEYQPDGTYVNTDEQWVKILTEKGRREESELVMRYNARYGEARFDYVGIIGTDGVEREINLATSCKESTDNSSMSVNIYDPMDRRLVCTIPGLQVGETIHSRRYQRATAARCENQWATFSILEWECPILKSRIRIKAPKELPLRKIAIRHPIGNVVESKAGDADGSVTYTWELKNSPQAFPEPYMPPLYTQIQHLRVSTAKSWNELSSWYWNLSVPHLTCTTEAITNKVNEIIAGVETPEDRVRAVYKWVAQEIRYMGLTMEDKSPGYAPHDVNVTFDNRYGVCRDKAALLAAMLRIAGIEAYPVLINAGPKMDPEVPLPYFNHAIVAVESSSLNGLGRSTQGTDFGSGVAHYVLMDPTDESSRDLMPAYLGDKSFLVARPEGETLLNSPIPTAQDNLCRIDSAAVINDDGSVLLDQVITFRGINDNAFRQALLRRKPDERDKFFEGILRGRFAGAEMLKCDIKPDNLQDTEKELTVRLVSRIPEMILRGRTENTLDIPLLSRTFGIANSIFAGKTTLEKRRFPIDVDYTAAIEEELHLRLNSSIGTLRSLPKPVKIEGPFEYSYNCAVKDDELVVNRRLAVNAVELSGEEYATLRSGLQQEEASSRAKPVFTKDRFANANVSYLLESNETDFQAADSWVNTNRVVEKILTYDGKKRSSELKFNYNPTYETIKVLSAKVTSPDGSVAVLTDKEINEMDCAWAAKAPRYPASKQLIVNLPSVEIGSEIDYTIETTVRKAPLPYYNCFFFDVYEPADRLFVRVGSEIRDEINPKQLQPETMTGPGSLWRDCIIVSSNTFAEAAARLRPAAQVEAFNGEGLVWSKQEYQFYKRPRIEAIRNWMARNVKVGGPGLWELPIDKQLTAPEVVLKERYATRLDYIRTLCALYKGAGYEADVVFASYDAAQIAAVKRRDMYEKSNPGVFAWALCRLCVKDTDAEGNVTDEKTYFVGIENEYTPMGTSMFDGSHFFDAASEKFGIVNVPEVSLQAMTSGRTAIDVKENGTVDFHIEKLTYGFSVGDFRKSYGEMLPEDRKRHYRAMVNGISNAAVATSPLLTDTVSYPARLEMSCTADNFAVVNEDSITLTIPTIANIFPLSGSTRKCPICIGESGSKIDVFTVTFPEGYTEIEQLPEKYSIVNPLSSDVRWIDFRVSSQVKDNRVTVTVERQNYPHGQALLDCGYFALLRDWNRIGAARYNRTITVRKPVK